MTKTRQTDRFGNVYYEIHQGGTLVGRIDKTCGGYQATFANGSYVPTRSIKDAMAVLAK